MKAIAAKTSIFLFLLYLNWYKDAFRHIPLFLYGGAVLVVATTLLYVNHKSLKSLIPPKGVLIWVGFGIYSLLTGLVVAADRGQLVSSIITYMAFMIVCWCICIVCRGEDDIQWLLKCIWIVCCVCTVYTVLYGKPSGKINGMNVITMSAENNPNSLGVFMTYGMFSALYNKKSKVSELVLAVASVLLFFYVIILTGSRKSLISGGLLCVIWLITFVKDTHKLSNKKEKKIRYGLLMAVLAIGITYFIKEYANTVSFERLQILGSDGSTLTRMELYRESVELFKSSKLFGVGYNQFIIRSSLNKISHSTYAEVLAGGGIFGCILYFYPVIKAGITLIKELVKKPSYPHGMLFALYVVELFLGVGMIFMYSFAHLIMWSVLYMTVENASIIGAEDYDGGRKLCQRSKHFLSC